MRAEAVTGQPRQGQSFEFQAFTVTAQRATEQVALELALPATVRVESATAAGSTCAIEPGSVRCALGDLATAESRRLDLRIVPADVGALAITARTRSEDDDDASNDNATLQLNVTTVVVQPPPATSGGGGGGSGGGGALGPGWMSLLLGSLAARTRRRVRREARPGRRAGRGRTAWRWGYCTLRASPSVRCCATSASRSPAVRPGGCCPEISSTPTRHTSDGTCSGLAIVVLWSAMNCHARRWLLVTLASAIAVSAGLYLLSPPIEWYLGFSGVLHGLLLAGLLAQWQRSRSAVTLASRAC